MNPVIHSSGIDGQRAGLLLLGVTALVLLAGSLWYASSARDDLAHAMRQLAEIDSYHQQAQRFEAQYAEWDVFQQRLAAFEQSVGEFGLVPSQWRNRPMTVEREVMSRSQVQAYLSSLFSRDGYYFLPERFSLSVVHDTDDLLRWQPGSTDDLQLTLVGNYLIRQSP
jgi:hypothetical protein